MSDLIIDDYATEGQLFYKPADKINFENALNELSEHDRHVVIVTDHKALAERYFEYFITRITIRGDLIVDARTSVGVDDLLKRFSGILSSSMAATTNSISNNDVRYVIAMINTSEMRDHEWSVLGRLLKNFSEANIRILAFVSESKLNVIDSVFDRLDDQIYRWILTTPRLDHLKVLLEVGELYNYRSESIQMVEAMGYSGSTEKSNDNLVDEFNTLDANSESLQLTRPRSLNGNGQSTFRLPNERQAGKNKPEANKTTAGSSVEAPSPLLTWGLGTAGVTFILVALLGPWEPRQEPQPEIQISAQAVSNKFTPGSTNQPSNIDKLNLQNSPYESRTSLHGTPVSIEAMPSRSATALRTLVDSSESKETSSSGPNWNDQMTQMLVPEKGDTSDMERAARKNALEKFKSTDELAIRKSEETVSTETTLAPLNPPIVALQMNMTSEKNPSAAAPTGNSMTIDTPSEDTDASSQAQTSLQKTIYRKDSYPRTMILTAPHASYFIQLGVFANQTQAQLLLDKLPPAAQAFHVRLNKSGRKLSTILSGPYESKVAAEIMSTSSLNDFPAWIRTAKAVQVELN